jgi:hypothetical protein
MHIKSKSKSILLENCLFGLYAIFMVLFIYYYICEDPIIYYTAYHDTLAKSPDNCALHVETPVSDTTSTGLVTVSPEETRPHYSTEIKSKIGELQSRYAAQSLAETAQLVNPERLAFKKLELAKFNSAGYNKYKLIFGDTKCDQLLEQRALFKIKCEDYASERMSIFKDQMRVLTENASRGVYDICGCNHSNTEVIDTHQNSTCSHDRVRIMCFSEQMKVYCCKCTRQTAAEFSCDHRHCVCAFHMQCLPKNHTVLTNMSRAVKHAATRRA